MGALLDRRYELVRVIGEGAMGSVHEARHAGTQRRVAIKLIKDPSAKPRDRAERASRFRREARTAGAIESPHIVQILDSGTDEATGTLYLVMEYLAGEDLQHLIDALGPLPADVALRIAGQALLGLEKAHAAGIVHRDIKPANLFLARQSDGTITVKILDFGIARIRRDPLAASSSTVLTRTGRFLGSPLYMSPEQVQDSRDVDPRADLWSLGCTLYCALSGHAPHHAADSMGKLILAICDHPAPPLHTQAPWVDPEVERVVHGALAIAPGERYPSATAMLEAIRPLAPGGLALREEMLVGVKPKVPSTAQGATTELHVSTTQLESDDERDAPGDADEHGPRDSEPAIPAPAPAWRRWFTPTTGRLALLALNVVVIAYLVHRRAPASPELVIQHGTLTIVPGDAVVEVDGERAAVHDGRVDLVGGRGTTHQIVLRQGSLLRARKVYLTEDGVIPSEVALDPGLDTHGMSPEP